MNSRVKKWLIGVVFAFAGFFLALNFIVSIWLHPMVERMLNEAVSLYTDGLYDVRYDKVRIKPLQRKIEIDNFRLLYDSIRVESDTALQNQLFVSASAQNITLAIGQLGDLFFHRLLNISHVSVVSPHLALYNYSHTFRRPEGRFDAFLLVKPYFDAVHINYVNISEASFKINNASGKPFQDFLVQHINASVANLVIDSGTVYRNHGYPKADQFTLMVNNARYMLPDSLHDVSVGRAFFDPIRQVIQLSEVALLPKADKHAFARDLGYQKEWIKGRIGMISMIGIDMDKLVVENILTVDRLAVDSAGIFVYRDRNVQRRSRKAEVQPLVAQSMQDITVPFIFDTITVTHARVVYEEQAPLMVESGEVSFEEVFASVYHVTNLPGLQTQAMQADVEAMFMGKSKLNAHINFPLNRKDGLHHVSGQLAGFPLEAINKMIEPTAFASVKSGVGHHLSFDMDVDNNKATGTMIFEYSGLKVALLNNKNPEENPRLRHRVGSVLANWFVVKMNNIPGKDPIRQGIIAYKRPEGGSIFSYWSHALISGLKMSVGIQKEPAFSVEPIPNETAQAEPKKKGLLKRVFARDEKHRP